MMISEKTIRDTLLIGEDSRDSYLLYGSYARGDYESTSDVDVLRITTSRKRASRVDGHVWLHTYDIKDLIAMARLGSLFILHLVLEAKPLHDPCEYLGKLSAAFQKPDSYTSEARRTVAPTSVLLDVSESLFEIAPRPFMDAALFLCRTLLYAEHAERGNFSFSVREMAANDETALMIWNTKHRSASYSDFRSIRQVVRIKTQWNMKFPDALSLDELGQRSQGNLLFDGLLRRIAEGLQGDAYVMTVDVAPNNMEQRGERISVT